MPLAAGTIPAGNPGPCPTIDGRGAHWGSNLDTESRSIGFSLVPVTFGEPSMAQTSTRPVHRPTRKILALTVLLMGAAGFTALPVEPAYAAVDGVASYYGKRFHGRKTASGTRFDMHGMTAAHKTWRFGSRVKVTNKSNGRSVVVTVNDRGPFVRGRTIDLSYAAAREIGMIQSGVARVKIEPLGRAEARSRGKVADKAPRRIQSLDDLF